MLLEREPDVPKPDPIPDPEPVPEPIPVPVPIPDPDPQPEPIPEPIPDQKDNKSNQTNSSESGDTPTPAPTPTPTPSPVNPEDQKVEPLLLTPTNFANDDPYKPIPDYTARDKAHRDYLESIIIICATFGAIMILIVVAMLIINCHKKRHGTLIMVDTLNPIEVEEADEQLVKKSPVTKSYQSINDSRNNSAFSGPVGING